MKTTQRRNYLFYLLSLLGHDVFYFAFSLYLIRFITGPLFNSADPDYNHRMVGIVSTIIVVVRIGELVVDPFLGALIDNTKTRFGSFKPWILAGGIVCSCSFVMLFTTLGHTNLTNPVLYLVLFTVLFLIMDGSYSLYDIALWSMIPAISTTYDERNTVGAVARLGAGIGQLLVTIFVMPSVLLGKGLLGGEQSGWLFFSVIVLGFTWFSALCAFFGVKELEPTHKESDAEPTKFREVFSIILKNDQLAWLSVSNWCYYFALALVSTLMTYYFQYIYGNAASYSTIFGTATLAVVISVLFYPLLTRRFSRKQVLFAALLVMLISMAMLFSAGSNTAIVIIASVMFLAPQPIIFTSFLLELTDTVDYGQWKSGKRNVSLTLAVRPLLDKFAGALSNGAVGLISLMVGMTGASTIASVSDGNKLLFRLIMCGLPAVMILISMVVYHKKFKLDEAFHERIIQDIMQ